MRSANLVIMFSIGLLATALSLYAFPVGNKSLAHWAMTLGMFSSAAIASWIFALVIITNPINKNKPQVIALFAYAASLIFSIFAGASFGVVYHVMETEQIDFGTAFHYAKISIYGGYAIAAAMLFSVIIYLRKKQESALVEAGANA